MSHMARLDIVSKASELFQHYVQGKVAPFISPSTAAELSVFYTLLYVIPFYLSRKTRPSPQLPRDDPAVIRARIRAVTLSCIVICAITCYVSLQYAKLSASEILRTFGLWPVAFVDLVKVLALVAILFAGPLFERGIVEGEWSDWVRGRSFLDAFSHPAGWRTYVAGPVSEEFVWRGMIISLHLFARVPATKIVFTTPLYFGIAHAHHCYEFKLTHPNTPLLPAILRSVFQFTYTSVFGFFAAFVFIRTGNVWAAILAHSFCNWMGLPRFWGRVEAPVPLAPLPDVNRKDDATIASTSAAAQPLQGEGRSSVLWTLVYYLLLLAGAVAFYLNLYTLTESRFALVRDWP